MLRPVLLLMIAICFAGMNLGCASRDRSKSSLDNLWEQGYGYNNPNAEKARAQMRERE